MPENEGIKGKKLLEVIYTASVEVASAIMTALATTIVSFLPVFAMEAAEGKLFRPLAFTKTFAMVSALVLGLIVVPALAHTLFSLKFDKKRMKRIWSTVLIAFGVLILIVYQNFLALALIGFGVNNILEDYLYKGNGKLTNLINTALIILTVVYFLTQAWLPLGTQNSFLVNLLFVVGIVTIVLASMMSIVHFFPTLLRWCLSHKWQFLSLPLFILLFGITAWQGFDNMFGFAADGFQRAGWEIRQTKAWRSMVNLMPGVGKEFMPPLDEGSYLLMPTTMSCQPQIEPLNVHENLLSVASAQHDGFFADRWQPHVWCAWAGSVAHQHM